MATGETMLAVYAQDAALPATLAAALDIVVGTSTPAENIPVLAYDDTTVEYADWLCWLPRSYGGGGLTLTFGWAAAAATNNGVWAAAFRHVPDDAEDLNTTAHTYDYNTTADLTPASAVGEVVYDTLTFTNGADMDSVVAGSYFILRVKRPAPSGTKITGDQYLHVIEIKET